MDGFVAPLDEIVELAEKYDALVMVDDSHAVGFVGETGAGTPELFGVRDKVDIVTGTLGKALGGASGGYTAARAEIVEILRQRSRPYLFSNSLAPSIAAAAIATLDLLETSGDLLRQLRDNTAYFRAEMTDRGFDIPESDHPIVPVMIGDAVEAVGDGRPAAGRRDLRPGVLASRWCRAARRGSGPRCRPRTPGRISSARSPPSSAPAADVGDSPLSRA